MKDRLITEQQRYLTLEKLTKEATAKTDQQQQQKNKTGYTVGDQRPAALVKKYGELYSQTRLVKLISHVTSSGFFKKDDARY